MGCRRDQERTAAPSMIQRMTDAIRLIVIAPLALIACGPALVGNHPSQASLDPGNTPAERRDTALTEVFGEPFRLGSEVGEVRPLLLNACDEIDERHYEGAMAEPFERQVQIDCHGLAVLGAKRKVEFMFNDGPLGHIWILVDREELSDLETTLRRLFGPVVDASEKDLLFESGGVVLRNDPPEVLIATPVLVKDITGLSDRD